MDSSSENWIERGKACLAVERLSHACLAFRQAVISEPDGLEANFLLANCLVQLQRLTDALEVYDTVIASHPKVAALHFSKANALFLVGDFSGSVDSYRLGLEYEINHDALRNLAQAYVRKDDLKLANDVLRQILRTNPKDDQALHLLTDVCVARQLPKDAENIVRGLLERSPDNAPLWFKLGNLCSDQKKLQAAIEAYRRVIDLKPNAAEAHFNLGQTLSRLDDLDNALTALQKSLALRPDYLRAAIEVGSVQARMKNPAAAEATFRQAMEDHPQAIEPVACLGKLLVGRGDLELAAETYQRLLQIETSAEHHAQLARIYSGMERYEDAITQLEIACQLEPEMVDSWLWLGVLHGRLRGFEWAEACFREAIRIEPDRREAFKYLWHLFVHFEQPDKLPGLVAEWTERMPDDPIAEYFQDIVLRDQTTRAPDDYIRAEFDDFAESFDASIQALGYQVPTLIRDAVSSLFPDRSEKTVLDAGCGTGLCAPHLGGGRLIGVDLSSKMVERAAERNLYDELSVAEIGEFLCSTDDRFDLIVYADTLCYFGDLREVLLCTKNVLRGKGYVVFSVELLGEASPDDEFKQSYTGRFKHTESYIRRVLEDIGLQLHAVPTVTLRQEGGQDVKGYLVTASL